MSSATIHILRPEDLNQILSFESRHLSPTSVDDIELKMAAWSARWREESLRHYLGIGWSFAVFADGDRCEELQGYFLAQPLLFFRGMTQTLWIEHLNFESPEAGAQLIDTAYRWAKDKHLQKVLLSDTPEMRDLVQPFRPQFLREGLVELATTRMNT